MTTQHGQGGAAAAAASAQPQLAPHPQPVLGAPSVAAATPSTPPQRSPHHALVAYVPAVAGAEAGALTVAGAGGGLPSGVADPLAEDGECEEVAQLERCNVQDRVALTAAVRRVQELCRRTKAAADRSRLSTAESDTLRGLAERVWLWCNRQSAQLVACKDIHAAGKSHTPQAAKLLRAEALVSRADSHPPSPFCCCARACPLQLECAPATSAISASLRSLSIHSTR